MLSESSSVKGSPGDNQPFGPNIRGSAKISWQVTLALYSGHFLHILNREIYLFNFELHV